jgi:hypothetical protein
MKRGSIQQEGGFVVSPDQTLKKFLKRNGNRIIPENYVFTYPVRYPLNQVLSHHAPMRVFEDIRTVGSKAIEEHPRRNQHRQAFQIEAVLCVTYSTISIGVKYSWRLVTEVTAEYHIGCARMSVLILLELMQIRLN